MPDIKKMTNHELLMHACDLMDEQQKVARNSPEFSELARQLAEILKELEFRKQRKN